VGDVIRIRVFDDFKARWVHVNITDASGQLIEEGEAVSDATGYEWQYTATAVNDGLSDDRITVSVSDMPGNITQKEHIL
jgi:hypothetical protein